MESVLAVMVVVISLTAFLSFLALSMSVTPDKETEIPLDFLDDVRMIGGNIEADIEEEMAIMTERYGYLGMRVRLSISDGIYDSSVTVKVGTFDSDVITTKQGTITVRTDDGRSVPVMYTVAVWT